MLEPGLYKLHLLHVLFGPMDLTTMIHQEAAGRLVEGAEEDSMRLADSCSDLRALAVRLATEHQCCSCSTPGCSP